MFRVTYSDALKELPPNTAKRITNLPDFTYDLDPTKFSNVTEYSDRHDELLLAEDGEAPSLRQNHKLIRDLIPGVKRLFQQVSNLMKRTLIAGHRMTTQETREYGTIAEQARGIMDVLQEVQYSKFRVTIAKPLDIFQRLEVLVGFTQLATKSYKGNSQVEDAVRKLARRLCDFRTRPSDLEEHLETIEMTIEANQSRNLTVVVQRHSPPANVSSGTGEVEDDSGEPETENDNDNYDHVAAGMHGLTLTARPNSTGRRQPPRPTASGQFGSEPSGSGTSSQRFREPASDDLAGPSTESVYAPVLREALRRGDLPPKFFQTTVKFERKSPREHITRNEIPVFAGDDSDPLALTFLDFFERFYETFHKYSYETFPAGEKLFALEKYTDGAAKQAVQVYRVTSHLSGYIECVRDLYVRWGQIGSAIEEIKLQLTLLSPPGYTTADMDKFMASIQACKMKLIGLGEKDEDAAYCAAMQVFSKLPPTAIATFRAMYCKEGDFRSSARRNPELTYSTLRRWVFNNNKEIESAGGAAPSSSQEYLPTSIFSVTATGTTKQTKQSEAKKPEPQKKPQPTYSQQQKRVPITYGEQKEEAPPAHSDSKPSPKPQTKPTETQKGICTICESTEHRWFECPHPLKERVRLVRLNNRCFNCLTKGHTKERCRSAKTCRNCKAHGIDNPERKHHTALCDKENKLPTSAPTKTKRPAESPSVSEPEDEDQPPPKKTKKETAMAAVAEIGDFTPQHLEAARKILGLPGPSTSKI